MAAKDFPERRVEASWKVIQTSVSYAFPPVTASFPSGQAVLLPQRRPEVLSMASEVQRQREAGQPQNDCGLRRGRLDHAGRFRATGGPQAVSQAS